MSTSFFSLKKRLSEKIPESVGSLLDFVEQDEAELDPVGVLPVQFVLR
jgi:hypothetical protein